MEVILLEKMKKLGDIGQTVNVKPGYARNYLFPNKIAIRATKENIEFFDKQKEDLNFKAKDFIIKQLIKNLGEFTGTLILHPEITKEIRILVLTTEK